MERRWTRAMSNAARAAAIAEQLLHESSVLLELYRKKENFTEELVPGGGLVSVPPSSLQPNTADTLWRLHSALLQCRGLMDQAVAKEEEELGGGKEGEYERQRKTVKERLSLLLFNTGELLKGAGRAAPLKPGSDGAQTDSPAVLFELKLWIYRIFKEVEFWSRTAITTLQGQSSQHNNERAKDSTRRNTPRPLR